MERQALSLKSLSFNYLTTPNKESGFSSLQSACIKGDVDTVLAILNLSPDKLDSAIALSVKIGPNAPHFPGKSILTVLKHQDTKIIRTSLKQFQRLQSIFSLNHFYTWLPKREMLNMFADFLMLVNPLTPCTHAQINEKMKRLP